MHTFKITLEKKMDNRGFGKDKGWGREGIIEGMGRRNGKKSLNASQEKVLS